jgi:hypothetical protein
MVLKPKAPRLVVHRCVSPQNPSVLAQYGRAAKWRPGHTNVWVNCTLSRRAYQPIIDLMTRRAPVFRLFALLLLATFGFVQVGRAHAHQCPTHDGGVQTAETTSHHAGHDASSTSSTSSSDQQHEQCNCLGECCTSPVATNVDSPTQLVLATSFTTSLAISAHDSVVVASAEHRLPFSIGPPSVSFIA